MGQNITVYIEGKPVCTAAGTTLAELAARQSTEERIVLGRWEGRLCELTRKVQEGMQLSFVTAKEKAGRDTLRRSLVLLMLKAIYHCAGDNENLERVSVHFSLGDSYYCTLKGKTELTGEFLESVKAYMEELIRQAAPIEKLELETGEACRRFHAYRMYDKEELFRYRRASRVNVYRLLTYEDYFYGYMVPDASYLTDFLTKFDLQLFEDGFLLCFSPYEKPASIRVWQAQKEAVLWGEKLGVGTVGALNTFIVKQSVKELILIQEAYHEKKLAELASQIAASPQKRVILIAGPSSSGKTTFSHRLSTQLAVHGLKPHPIEADNYFVDREKTPLDEEGKPNFECLEAIDVEKLNEDMLALLAGERVELPRFNFKTGRREYKGDFKQLGERDLLVIEGIHCLNDALTHRLNPDLKYKIYISALTQLNVDEHNRIPTTDGRLLRRMVRDNRMRGMNAKATIAMWPSVRRGEETHIFPFQESADFIFNSTLIYELAVLKQYAEPLLFSVSPSEPEFEEAKRLLKFLDYFLPIPSEDIPNDSLVREFIGGSCFE